HRLSEVSSMERGDSICLLGEARGVYSRRGASLRRDADLGRADVAVVARAEREAPVEPEDVLVAVVERRDDDLLGQQAHRLLQRLLPRRQVLDPRALLD